MATKLESFNISGSVIKCLVLLSKLYIEFFKHTNFVEEDKTEANLTFVHPLLKRHLLNEESLVNMIKNLDEHFQNSAEFIDLLAEFLIYVNLLTEGLSIEAKHYAIDIARLKNLFKWSTSNFNINDLQIDSIPISKSKSRPNNENSLDNLLVWVVNCEQNCHDESGLGKKIMFCSSLTKKLVNTLNEVSSSQYNRNDQNVTDEIESSFSLTSKIFCGVRCLISLDIYINRSIRYKPVNKNIFL